MELQNLRSILRYDSDTGNFVWIKTMRSDLIGKVAGARHPDGYISIKLNKRLYLAHRLAWFHFYGIWPDLEIDHIDGDRKNNRIGNLRLANKVVNGNNRRQANKNNISSGYLGVTFHKQANKYRAKIATGGKEVSLGLFSTAEKAHDAYLVAKRKLHEGCEI